MMKKIFMVIALIGVVANLALGCIVAVPPDYSESTPAVTQNNIQGVVSSGTTQIAVYEIPSVKITDEIITISLPATLSVKIGEFSDSESVNNIRLEYQNKEGEWVVVRELNVEYSLKTDVPVPHFGLNTLDPVGFSSGDSLQVRVYLTDGVYETYLEFNFVVDSNRRPY